MSISGRKSVLIFAPLVVIVTFIAYMPALRAGFIWDDDILVTKNPWIKATDGLLRFWWTTPKETPDFFPLTSSLFWVQWRMWGSNPAGYHAVNIALHAINAILIGVILSRLKFRGAWLAAIIFALHPVNVASVAWIAELKNTLSMFFYLLTFLAFVQFQDDTRPRWYFLALAAFLLALLSKTSVVMLPFVLLGLIAWRQGTLGHKDVLRVVPFFLLAGLFGLITVIFQAKCSLGEIKFDNETFLSRLAGAGWAFWFYLYKAVLPFNLSMVYPRWKIDPSTVLSYLPLVALIGCMVSFFRYRKTWARPFLYAFGYVLLSLLPILGLINTSFRRFSLVADHWHYLAIVGSIVLVVHLGVRTFASRRTGLVLAVLVPLLFLGLTFKQSAVYKSEETLWLDTLAKNPSCWIGCNHLGNAMAGKGRFPEAIAYYQRALELKPSYAAALNGLGTAFHRQGQISQARECFERALSINPGFPDAHVNLGMCLVSAGDLEGATAHFRKALDVDPCHVNACNNLGDVYFRQGKFDEAVALLEKARALDPGFAGTYHNLGLVLAKMGKHEEAFAQYRRALFLNPGDAGTYLSFGKDLAKAGRTEDAVVQFRRALDLRPGDSHIHLTLAMILAQANRVDEACDHFREAIRLRPGSAQTHALLASVLSSAGKAREAVDEYRMSLKLQPEAVVVLNNLAWILATHPDAAIRNGREARELAKRACRIDPDNVQNLDTLAAAYAECGQFAEAIQTVEKAIDLAKRADKASSVAEFESHLALYRTHKPLRDNPARR